MVSEIVEIGVPVATVAAIGVGLLLLAQWFDREFQQPIIADDMKRERERERERMRAGEQ